MAAASHFTAIVSTREVQGTAGGKAPRKRMMRGHELLRTNDLADFLALEQSPLRGIHQLTQYAIGLSSSLGSAVPSIGTQPTARLVARPRQGAVSRGPTPLGLAVEGRAENAVVVIAGLAPDME